MRWILRLSPLYFLIIHCSRRKQKVTNAFFQLRRDGEPEFPSDDDEIPNFEEATVLAVRTPSGMLTDADPHRLASSVCQDTDDDRADDPSDEEVGLLDEEDLELDSIDLY